MSGVVPVQRVHQKESTEAEMIVSCCFDRCFSAEFPKSMAEEWREKKTPNFNNSITLGIVDAAKWQKIFYIYKSHQQCNVCSFYGEFLTSSGLLCVSFFLSVSLLFRRTQTLT